MIKTGITTLFLMSAMSQAQAQPLIGRLASTPVQHFNEQIQRAGNAHQSWVNDYREVALRFIANPALPSRIQARQVDNELILSVALDDPHSDQLYILTLFRHNDMWQMRHAEMGWRCQGDRAFTPVPCPR
ncbi:hypothetical protein [Aeromonas diversa]|nr:hypothetical protein [Aeromonas diversa]